MNEVAFHREPPANIPTLVTAFVTCLLHHAKDPVVSLDMIVGALAVFPPQKDDHLGKLVSLNF